MSFSTLHDVVNNGFIGHSIAPLSRTAQTVDGAAIDCTNCDGPINALSTVGAATGTPDSMSVIPSLIECDTSGGSYTAIANQTSPGAQTAAGTVALRGIRTKQFVKVRQVISFVNGTSPAVPSSGVLIGQKRSY